ncbi:IS4 family transposase [Roseiconus nitratireducens]|uniref:IS4 family transposase n=1 Tax=Roseiconus nitratireducens TaxID=2605748 RepID=UPI00137616D2|nr:IS4 family transposase [Roseiconus nitratireducens]
METIVDEFLGADLGDERLNRRLKSLAHTLASKPSESIPAAADSRAEWEAAYRFFDNDRVSPEKVLAPHREATLERVSQASSIVLVQDTTQVNLTRPTEQVQGAGYLGCDSQYGVFYHPLMAFTEQSLALGMVWQKHWTRDEEPSRLSKTEKAKQRRETPIEQKESVRWIEGIHASAEVAELCPDTQCIAVADSESDIYEVLAECTGQKPANFQFVIRAGQDRTTEQDTDWFESVRGTRCIERSQVKVSRRRAKFRSKKDSRREGDREARTAELEIRAAKVTLKAPWRPDRKLPTVDVNLVLCEEVSPPEGTQPIVWLLVTQLPIDSVDAIRRVIDIYCIRWQIEIFFRTLKSGCRIEERYLRNLPRSMNAIALYSVIAWRILYLTQVGRTCPDLNCEMVFDSSEWKSVYTVLHHQRADFRLPKAPPTLNEMIKMIARLGGYIDRPSENSHPGPKTLWIGLQQTHSLSSGWLAFGPESKKFSRT